MTRSINIFWFGEVLSLMDIKQEKNGNFDKDLKSNTFLIPLIINVISLGVFCLVFGITNWEFIIYAVIEAGIATAILNLSGRVRGRIQKLITTVSYITLYVLALVQFFRALA